MKATSLSEKVRIKAGFGVVALRGGQHKTQRVAQGIADGVDFGVQPCARDADGLWAADFAGACRRLRPAARRVHHHLLQVGLLHALKNAFEMVFLHPYA